jgi:hypothetical protein
MKYIAILFLLLLSFTFVAADTCNTYCETEGYGSGVCRAADEDVEDFCESDETLYGSFDMCETGSFERCCCSGEISEEPDETPDAVEEVVDEETQCKLVQLNIEKEDLPIIIFFELLLVVVILALVALFRGPKSHEFE